MLETVCGAFVGACHFIIGHPLDSLKVNYQTSELSRPLETASKNKTANPVKKLWRGASALIIGLPLATSIQFGMYEYLKKRMTDSNSSNYGQPPEETLSLNKIGIAGMLAGSVSALLYCPLEYAKIQAQVGNSTTRTGSLSIIAHQISQGKVGRLYNGLGLTVLRQSIGGFCYFGAYEAVVRLICKRKEVKRRYAEFGDFFIGGAAAGLAYSMVSYPIDFIKTRVQGGLPRDQSWKQMKATMSRGLSTSILRSTLVNAIGFSIYEQVKGISQIFTFIGKS